VQTPLEGGDLRVRRDEIELARPALRPLEVLRRRAVAGGYTDIMRMPLLRGRSLTRADVDRREPNIVVSKAIADAYFPGQDAIGRRVRASVPPNSTLPTPDGFLNPDDVTRAATDSTVCVIAQSPNFFGILEDVAAAAELAHAAGALLVVVSDPVNLGVLEGPGRLGADIVVGEGQGLGVPMSFGGPNLGVFAARSALVRRMPGRLVGATVDRDGARGFVLTLQTREQHIRRAKATSNICTNVALCALMATIYLATLGKQGLRRVGELSTAKAHYAAVQLTKIPGVSLRFAQPFFKEFVLRLPKPPAAVGARLAKRRILPGVPLKTYDRTLADCLLVAVTEQRTREEIDAYAAALAEVLK